MQFPWTKSKSYQFNEELEGIKSLLLNNLQHTISRRGSQGQFGISPDGKRNYNELFGYGQDLQFEDYYGMWRRSGIANVVVSKVAKSCWRDTPKLMVGDDEVLANELQQLIDVGLFSALEKADILNRIGRFSALFVGIPDNLKADEPLGAARDLSAVTFNAYTEQGITFTEYDNEASSPRFGLPVLYQVMVRDFGDKSKTVNLAARVVNWERIVHFAEGSLDSPIEGISALGPVWNAITDTVKVRGGAAEAYFRNARRLLNMMARKEASIDETPEGLSALRTEVESFVNSMQDVIRTEGFDVEAIATDTPTPREAFDVAVEEVSAQTGIPIRVLTGKGGGQLTGSEDRAAWNALVSDRQMQFCTDQLRRALEMLEQAGMLKIPDNMVVEWPPQKALNETEEAENTAKRSTGLMQVLNGASSMAGDQVKLRSALDAVGFQDVELEDDLEGEE